MTVTLNATEARKKFFDLLTAAKFKKQVTRILVNGELYAVIKPVKKKKINWEKYLKEMEEGLAYLRKLNWNDVLEVRKKTKVRKYKGW